MFDIHLIHFMWYFEFGLIELDYKIIGFQKNGEILDDEQCTS